MDFIKIKPFALENTLRPKREKTVKRFVNHLSVKGFINQNLLRAPKTQTYGRKQHNLTKWVKGFNTLKRIQCMINTSIMFIKRCSALSLEKFKFKQREISLHIYLYGKNPKI